MGRHAVAQPDAAASCVCFVRDVRSAVGLGPDVHSRRTGCNHWSGGPARAQSASPLVAGRGLWSVRDLSPAAPGDCHRPVRAAAAGPRVLAGGSRR
jgi:hypothetical protein